MLDVRRLMVLLAVREHGSIAAAAQALSFTPPAVSQQVAALERQVGTALLDRGRRRVRLTDAGERLAGHAERILAQLESAAAEMATINDHAGGVLRIGTLATAGTTLLPGALLRLRETAPALEARVEQMEAGHSLPALKRGDLDVAIAGEYDSVPQRLDPTIERVDFLTEPVFVAVPVDHRLDGPAARLSDLRADPWVAAAPGSACLTLLERACGLVGFTPDVVAHCGDFAMALEMVRARVGVALVPAIATQPAGRPPPGVRYLTPREPTVGRTLFLAVRRGGAGRPAVQRLRDALVEAAARVRPTRESPAPQSRTQHSGEYAHAKSDVSSPANAARTW